MTEPPGPQPDTLTTITDSNFMQDIPHAYRQEIPIEPRMLSKRIPIRQIGFEYLGNYVPRLISLFGGDPNQRSHVH